MNRLKIFVNLFFFSIVLFSFAAARISAQTDEKKMPPVDEKIENADDEEVLKINTEIIQTSVAVLDKKGRFVDDLKAEDFEIFVDGKAVPISFFERNTTKRNPVETKIEKKSDGEKPAQSGNRAAKPASVAAGRTIIFVVDDFHLSFDSNKRARNMITNFIEREMSPADIIAVVSPSGKIGFLQQFTNDRTVLQAAVERLIYTRDRSASDRSPPPMTEYEALLVSQFDRDVTDIFAAQEFGGEIESRRERVRSRARIILTQAAAVNRGTYATLEQAVRNSAALAGRKIVFFISDGFLLDPANSDSSYQLKRITDAATRTNTVIYSFDAKGLEAGLPDGTTAANPRTAFRVQSGERFEVQDGLSLLADETGGKFVRNTNDLQTGLSVSLDDASQFYLLAWEPISESGKSDKFKRIEVRVRNRPELKIRFQNGYFNENPAQADADKAVKEKNKRDRKPAAVAPLSAADRQLNSALIGQTTVRQLSASLTVNHVDLQGEGALLAAAMQIKSDELEFVRNGEKSAAQVDVVGIVYDDDGKRQGYFRQLLTVETQAAKSTGEPARSNVYYNYQTKLKPGLYQMRVAARDTKSGRVGSAVQWVKIPDLTERKLALSSLILSEQETEENNGSPNKNAALTDGKKTDGGKLGELPVSVDRRFDRSSRLRYMIFIYNAAQKNNQPDVALQTQIFRGRDLIVTTPLNPVSAAGADPLRLPYIAEISLSALLPGRYELVITVQDRGAKTSRAQRISFEVK